MTYADMTPEERQREDEDFGITPEERQCIDEYYHESGKAFFQIARKLVRDFIKRNWKSGKKIEIFVDGKLTLILRSEIVEFETLDAFRDRKL